MAWSEPSETCGEPVRAGRFPADDPRCDACASGLLRRSRVDMAFWSGGRLVLVRDIPALVCNSCGEQYTEDDVVLQIDLMRGADFRYAQEVGRQEVPVFAYPGGDDAAP